MTAKCSVIYSQQHQADEDRVRMHNSTDMLKKAISAEIKIYELTLNSLDCDVFGVRCFYNTRASGSVFYNCAYPVNPHLELDEGDLSKLKVAYEEVGVSGFFADHSGSNFGRAALRTSYILLPKLPMNDQECDGKLNCVKTYNIELWVEIMVKAMGGVSQCEAQERMEMLARHMDVDFYLFYEGSSIIGAGSLVRIDSSTAFLYGFALLQEHRGNMLMRRIALTRLTAGFDLVGNAKKRFADALVKIAPGAVRLLDIGFVSI